MTANKSFNNLAGLSCAPRQLQIKARVVVVREELVAAKVGVVMVRDGTELSFFPEEWAKLTPEQKAAIKTSAENTYEINFQFSWR